MSLRHGFRLPGSSAFAGCSLQLKWIRRSVTGAADRKPIRQSVELWSLRVTPTDGCPSCCSRDRGCWIAPASDLPSFWKRWITNKHGGGGGGHRKKKWRFLRIVSAHVRREILWSEPAGRVRSLHWSCKNALWSIRHKFCKTGEI